MKEPDRFDFDWSLEHTPQSILSMSGFAAQIIQEWKERYGIVEAKRMVMSTDWIEPAKSLFATAWGE